MRDRLCVGLVAVEKFGIVVILIGSLIGVSVVFEILTGFYVGELVFLAR